MRFLRAETSTRAARSCTITGLIMRCIFALVLLCVPLPAQNADDKPCRADYTIRARYEEEGRRETWAI